MQVGVAETFWNMLKTARAPESHTDAGAAVPITIFGSVHMMPVSEVSKLTLPQYSQVCLVSAHKCADVLGHATLHLHGIAVGGAVGIAMSILRTSMICLSASTT